SDSVTYAGTLSGGGALEKNGAGTLTLSGNNSGYAGATTINAGTLALGSAHALGNGSITFAGNNTVLEATTSITISSPLIEINAGVSATFAATSGNTLTLAQTAASLNGGAGTTIHFGSASDLGTVVLAGPAAVDPGTAGAVDGGTLKIGSFGTSVIGNLKGGLTVGSSGTPAILDLNGNATAVWNLSGTSAGVITNTAPAPFPPTPNPATPP